MISHYHDLGEQVQQIQQIFHGNVCHIQKAFSTSRTLAIGVRVPGKTWYLVWGKGNHFEGIGLSEKAPISEIRLRDRLLEYFRKNITSSILRGIFLDQKDRILTLKYAKQKQDHYFSLFYLGRKTFMAHSQVSENGIEHFKSWSRKKESQKLSGEDLYQVHLSLFDELGRSVIGRSEKKDRLFPVEDIWEKEGLLASSFGEKSQNKKKKKLTRKIGFIKKDLENASQWQVLQSWVLGLNPEEYSLPDGKFKKNQVSFNFGFGRDFFFKREMIFQRIKRLKKAEIFLKDRLSQAMGELDNVHKQGEKNNSFPQNNIEIIWPQDIKQSLKKEKEQHFDIEFYTYEGVKYGVGLSAKSNDQLRGQFSKKNHWWFHLEGEKSAHVIAFTDKLTEGVIKRASFLLFQSVLKKQADRGEIDILYTQVKNLRSVSGQVGKVLFKKEKRRRIYLSQIKDFLDNEC